MNVVIPVPDFGDMKVKVVCDDWLNLGALNSISDSYGKLSS